MNKALIFVLGMHRSGTSLITKGLQVLGAELGDQLMPAAPDNPTGFWEDMDVYKLNQRMLLALDLDWDVPSIVPLEPQNAALFAEFQEAAQALLARKISKDAPLTIKDPRFALLLPVWLAAAADLSLEPRFVLVVRNPLDVAASLQARNGLARQQSLQMWLSANLSLVQMLVQQDSQVLCISYERFLQQVRPEMARLADFLQGALAPAAQWRHIDSFADGFVAPELCHSRSPRDALQDAEQEVPGIVALYECLAGLSEGVWVSTLARAGIEGLDAMRIEAGNFRMQRARERVCRHQLEQSLHVAEHREEELSTALEIQKREFNAALEAQKAEFNAVLETQKQAQQVAFRAKQREVQHWQRSQRATERHLNGALESIEAIRASLSYRLGYGLTWPIRALYDSLVEPFRRVRGNVQLMGRMVFYLLRHPIRSLHLLDWEHVRNAYITFFRNPGMAREVVGHYARLLHGEDLPESRRQDRPYQRHPTEGKETSLASGMVSVITVNYNGRAHLDGLLQSLVEQDYGDLEIILIDNGSCDGSVVYVREHYPAVKLVVLQENLGFAEANNIGAQVATGRYYCLINNDMELEPGALSRLVSMLQEAPDVGAVGPKIRFWKPFLRLTLSVRGPGSVLLDQVALEASLPVYPKVFFGPGWSTEPHGDSMFRGLSGESFIEVPVCQGQAEAILSFEARAASVSITVSIPQSSTLHHLDLPPLARGSLSIDLVNAVQCGAARYLINNAASEVDGEGNVCDRGFAKPDDGSFDQVEEVTALCGGAMLIRPEALQEQPIFAGELFAYYEDTDLSLRLRNSGYRLLYAPMSVVYHKHASTSREYSAFFRYYVSRNRILFQALHFPDSLWQPQLVAARDELSHLEEYYQAHPASRDEQEFAQRIPELLNDWDRLLPRILQGDFYAWPALFPRLAIYNSFWDTLGGGEHHAAVMALALQRLGPVDLLSDREFDLGALQRQFDLDLKFCRKRIVSAPELHHNPATTGHYDLFINSTFSSDLPCHARHAIYVVSFPFRLSHSHRHFLDSYSHFWANSHFTAKWIKAWWNAESQVVYPSVRLPESPASSTVKERRILHVGRFFRVGHNKKQLELVSAFVELIDSGLLKGDWRLTLVGKVHQGQEDYLREVQEKAQDYPVDFMTNASFEDLHNLFRCSAVYWHATGLGENEEEHPELFEHFGISTVEAMSYGCVPIVIAGGGQLETVREGVDGYLYRDVAEMKTKTALCIYNFEHERVIFDQMSQSAIDRAQTFSRETEVGRVLDLVSELGFRPSNKYLLI